MLRSARAPVSRLSNERRECQLSLDLSGSVNGVVLTLNDHFIGVIDQSARAVQAFDCRLLSNRKNVLKANYLKNEFRPALGITHAVIQDSKQISYSMELKEFLSMDLKSHLITIGTTGGIQ
jgi:hypothetical protein